MAFDSKQYSWCDLSIAWGGRVLEGVTALKYKETQDKDFLYGRGCKPHEIIRGNRSYEGSVKLWQSELEAMTEDAPDNDILKLRFNIIATYVPKDGGQTVVDVIDSAEVKEFEKAFNQGDKNMEIELPIIFLDVKRQQ
jgi:hypothetical protein